MKVRLASSTCPNSGTINPLKTCLVTVTFTPGATGSRSATLTVNGASTYPWVASTSDQRALEAAAAGSTNRDVGVWYSSTSFTFNLSLSDNQTHLLALYALDWDNPTGVRSEQFTISNTATGQVLVPQAVWDGRP